MSDKVNGEASRFSHKQPGTDINMTLKRALYKFYTNCSLGRPHFDWIKLRKMMIWHKDKITG